MNLRDLRYLVALADLRHFGRAAESCHVSQPTLSTQVKKLEEELGVSLVERAPRHVMLTAAGMDIAMRARRVLAEVEQMRETARRTADPEAGSVRLGLFPTLGPYLLPHVVPRIRKRFPRLELLLVEEKTEVVLHMLREGKLDAAVLALPLHEEWAETEFLFEEPFMLAVPDGFEVTLWAKSPLFNNPTNMDIDAQGRLYVVSYWGGEVWRLSPADGRMCLLVEGLLMPSAVAVGRTGHGFDPASVYITTHSGRVHRVPNAVPR